jgi:hypothetical protein
MQLYQEVNNTISEAVAKRHHSFCIGPELFAYHLKLILLLFISVV